MSSSSFLPTDARLKTACLVQASLEEPALTWLGLYTNDEELKLFLVWPLFQRLQWLRQQHQFSLELLGELTALPLPLLLDLEGGVQRLLATTHRLRLARALKVEPHWLVPHALPTSPTTLYTSEGEPHVEVDARTHELRAYGKRLALPPILVNPEGFWPCPACGKGLLARTFERRDPDDTPITALALTCTQCTFSHAHEFIEL